MKSLDGINDVREIDPVRHKNKATIINYVMRAGVTCNNGWRDFRIIASLET